MIAAVIGSRSHCPDSHSHGLCFLNPLDSSHALQAAHSNMHLASFSLQYSPLCSLFRKPCYPSHSGITLNFSISLTSYTNPVTKSHQSDIFAPLVLLTSPLIRHCNNPLAPCFSTAHHKHSQNHHQGRISRA